MGWAFGEIDGREVGYGVDAECDVWDCHEEIHRGVDYRCGGGDFDDGCGDYFCYGHLFIGDVNQACPTCFGPAVDALPGLGDDAA